MGVFNPLFYLATYAVEHGMSTRLPLYLLTIVSAASCFGWGHPRHHGGQTRRTQRVQCCRPAYRYPGSLLAKDRRKCWVDRLRYPLWFLLWSSRIVDVNYFCTSPEQSTE